MIKKLLFVLAVFLVLQGSIRAGWFGPTRGAQTTKYGIISSVTDTVFYSGGTYLLDFTEYGWWGWEVEIITPDTTIPDSMDITIFTGYGNTGWTVDSLDSVAASSLTGSSGTIRGNGWYCLHDTTTGAIFFRKGGAIRLNMSCVDTTDTATVNDDPWGAAGDSIRDWNHTGAGWESEVDEAIGSTDWADFLYVKGKDSLQVLGADNPFNADVYNFDSITVYTIVAESLNVIAMDTMRVGIAFGDTSDHHFDDLTTVWATQQALTAEQGGGNAADTLSWSFTTDPRGAIWQKANLDSLLLVFDPVHVDTTSAGAAGALVLYHIWIQYEANRDSLNPPVYYRITHWLKQ